MPENASKLLLEVKDLKTYFYTGDGIVKAVDGVDFTVNDGEVLGIVGESGCGKSVTCLSVMRLISNPGKIVQGEILFDDRNLLGISNSEMVTLRGNRMSMIFQQPKNSLNPVFNIGDQISEVLIKHANLNKKKAWAKTIDLLRLVGIPDTEKKAYAYPHELSGGQAQRVMIAMALALKPQLLIADEPTTALDVTIQAQILDLIRDLRNQLGTAVILITHDLGIIAEMADRVAVMYAGRIVEEAAVRHIFSNPLHPYTKGLITSIPILGLQKNRLEVIPGNVPNLIDLPSGCRFATRCKAKLENNLTICDEIEPAFVKSETGHKVRCWLYQDHGSHKALRKFD